jgi:hypothetical protein
MSRTAPRHVLLTVAAALCLGLAGAPAAGSAASSQGPAVVVDPAALPRGADTALLHTAGRRIVDGDRVVRVDLSGRLSLVGRAAHGYVVLTSDPDDGSSALWRVRRDGTARQLRPMPHRATVPQVSPDGDRVAWTVQGRDRSRLVVARTADGSLVGSVRRTGFLEVADLTDHRVLMTGSRPSRTLWFRPVAGTTQRLFAAQVWDADIAADRAVVAVEDLANGADGICLSFQELHDPSTRFWRSCTDKPLSFSPDHTLMVTTDIRSDGIGASTLELRDATHNTPIASYATDGGYFGDPVWEDADSFVVRVWAGGQATQVRVTTSGTVERVARVARVKADALRGGLWWTFAED